MKFSVQHYPMNILVEFEDGFLIRQGFTQFQQELPLFPLILDGNVDPIGIGISITLRNRDLLKLLIFHEV